MKISQVSLAVIVAVLVVGTGGFFLGRLVFPSISSLPDIGGVSSKTLFYLSNNPAVKEVTINVSLGGEVADVLTDANGKAVIIKRENNPSIAVTVITSTAIFEPPSGKESNLKDLKLEELVIGDSVIVNGRASGKGIVADTIIREPFLELEQTSSQ